MSNLIKNKLLITMLFVVSLLVMYDVGWSAVTPITLTSISRTAEPETQGSNISKILYTNTIRWDFDSAAAATQWYGDTNTTTPLIIPPTSLSGVTAWSAAAWIYTTGATGDFSDSIGASTDDTMEVVWEYSMDGNRWYVADKAATGHPQESRMLTQAAATNTGTNFIGFGPINRFGDRTAIMDSTSALKSIDAQVWPCASYVRARLYIHGECAVTNKVTNFATAVVKAYIQLKRD